MFLILKQFSSLFQANSFLCFFIGNVQKLDAMQANDTHTVRDREMKNFFIVAKIAGTLFSSRYVVGDVSVLVCPAFVW